MKWLANSSCHCVPIVDIAVNNIGCVCAKAGTSLRPNEEAISGDSDAAKVFESPHLLHHDAAQGQNMSSAFDQQANGSGLPAWNKIDSICIIGAGPSGLAAAK